MDTWVRCMDAELSKDGRCTHPVQNRVSSSEKPREKLSINMVHDSRSLLLLTMHIMIMRWKQGHAHCMKTLGASDMPDVHVHHE
jgi:hypothetical protein